jgi:hypothetical protein
MNEQNFNLLNRAVTHTARHSQYIRGTDYSSRNLSDEVIEDIGFQLVSLYESLYEKHVGGNGGGSPPQTGAVNGDQKQRQSDGYQPYR